MPRARKTSPASPDLFDVPMLTAPVGVVVRRKDLPALIPAENAV